MLCNSFKRLSLETWDSLRRCWDYGHQLGEESVTDFNLLKIKEWEPEVLTKSFTRRGERKSGGDWEWWFGDDTGLWIGIRIQAKIIRLSHQDFHHLHYPIIIEKKLPGSKTIETITTSQTEILIESSRTAEKTVYPLYCLYCFWEDEDIEVSHSCSLFGNINEFFGCSIIDAHKVLELNAAGENTLTGISEFLRPLHCLVCCPGIASSKDSPINPINGVDYFLRRVLNFPLANEIDIKGFDKLIHDAPPSYVTQVLNNPYQENSNKDSLYVDDEDLEGVVIFKLRTKQK